MGRIERKYDLSPISFDKNFFDKLLKIIKYSNKEVSQIRTEIIIQQNSERTSYEDPKDFFEDLNLPSQLDSLVITISPRIKTERAKGVKLRFNLDSEGERSFYELAGYDDGILMSTRKKIDLLIQEYKVSYWFLFKIESFWDLIKLSAITFLAYLTTLALSKVVLPPILPGYAVHIGFILFFIYNFFLGKFYEVLFPFIDFKVREVKRVSVYRGVFWTITLGLFISALWWGISRLIS